MTKYLHIGNFIYKRDFLTNRYCLRIEASKILPTFDIVIESSRLKFD